jgi:integrase
MLAEISRPHSHLQTGWPRAEHLMRHSCSRARSRAAHYDPRHLGFHTFRRTVASRLFADDRNAVEVQKWLGHHSPSFTLDTYVHPLAAISAAARAPSGRRWVGGLSGDSRKWGGLASRRSRP